MEEIIHKTFSIEKMINILSTLFSHTHTHNINRYVLKEKFLDTFGVQKNGVLFSYTYNKSHYKYKRKKILFLYFKRVAKNYPRWCTILKCEKMKSMNLKNECEWNHYPTNNGAGTWGNS